VFGVVPYVDPKILDPKIPYGLTKKSDIYSMGVIFWQLTSCSSPFNFKTRDPASITLEILNGVREESIPNTNVKFINLYQRKYNKIIISFYFYNNINNSIFKIECWGHEPDERPDADQVISELDIIDSENDLNFEVNEYEDIEITEELIYDENEDDFSDCNLSNY
jgi:serine/threonine protein kinase